jgi:site-specific DNA-methyltransferase (adenine-specific)
MSSIREGKNRLKKQKKKKASRKVSPARRKNQRRILYKENQKTHKLILDNATSVQHAITDIANSIIQGDSRTELRQLPDNYVDLIVTSPPYADSRKHTYGGINPDKYVEWFSPISEQLLRVVKPTGSFVLNIKERVVDGERHTYVIDLIKHIKSQGWFWTEEYIWHKKNSYPGKWPNRFRDSWERCLHFTKSKHFHMYQESVMVPMGSWKNARLRNLSATDKKRDESKVASGFGKKIENWVGRELAYPSNVLHMSTECSNKSHSAAYPDSLPEWFIKLFTKPGDIVLDPFLGSGTSAIVAARLGRRFIGIEINAEYCEMARATLGRQRVIKSELTLFENGNR